jgi:ABC-type multidrug transport system fused ATPase/permease subunit
LKDEDGKVFSSTAKPLRPSFLNGDIEFRNVSFVYPSRPDVAVLQNFNLRVPANTTAALVGSSGAGKSTVVSLLQRFYDVDSGSICIDGNDIRSLDLQWMRSQIGYVQQEPQLFGLTVRENVCFGVDRNVTDEEIETACKVSINRHSGCAVTIMGCLPAGVQ